MRVAHLILTYTNPKQTERMIRSLYHENFDFYIHVDKKFDINPHLVLEALPNVYFINNRVDVKWAGYSTVLATFECIKEIVATGIKYDFINFMSGQDYPIKTADQINDFFIKNKGFEFLSFRDFKNEWTEGLIRMEKYYLSDFHFKGKYMVENLINSIMPKRELPNDLLPFGKSMFWMLSPDAAMYVVNTVENDKKLSDFFWLCWASDEFVFQTILMNSSMKDKVINNNYRYIDWSKGGASPKTLDKTDAEKIKASTDLFARKFDMTESPEILDIIDKHILTHGSHN